MTWLSCLLTVLALGLAPALRAQGAATGTVTGTVLDSTSGKFLEGAEISVEGTDIHGATERGGRFTLNGVPSGPHNLVINYPGLEPKTESVSVSAGQSVDVPVRLSSDTVVMDTFAVTTPKEGMAQAQALQKVAVQYKLVLAADQFGPISEGNIGEYMKFLPGVSIDYNVNDARGVSLRGLSTAFTIVAIDGTPMAGASSIDDTRRFEFEQIAMNNVETTELFKTVTPDIPATATGGFVNFVTKSAFDRQDVQVISYDISLTAPSSNLSTTRETGVWGHKGQYTARPSLDFNLARRITSKLGININYRFSEKYDDSPRTEYTWNTSVVAGIPSIFDSPTAPRLQQYNIRSEQKLTHREAFATKLDYLISDDTKLTISGQWNWYDLLFTQRGPQFVLGTGAGVTRTGDSFTAGTGSSIQNGTLQREKYGTTIHFNGTLTHDFHNAGKASLTGYYSKADGQYRDTNKGFISVVTTMAPSATTYTNYTLSNVFDLGTLATINLTRSGAPLSTDFVRDASNYSFSNTTGSNFQSRPWTAKDIKKGANGEYTYEIPSLPIPVTVEVGGAHDLVHRDIYRPDLRGNIPTVTGSVLSSLSDYGYNKDVALGFGTIMAPDPYKYWNTYAPNLTVVNLIDSREFNEKNDAAFARFDAKVLPDLLLIGGVRWEKRTIDGHAQNLATARSKRTTIDLDHDGYYPSISLKYTPHYNRHFVLRSGFSQTIGIPDYSELLPLATTSTTPGGNDATISVPSPTLKPYKTNNFDISLDYYLGRSGVATIAVFRKDVNDFIISRGMTAAEVSEIIAANGLNPTDFTSGSFTIKDNGSRSRLQGLELSYAQQMSFLPKPFNGLNIQANFSLVDVNTYDSDPLRALDTLYSQLRAVNPKTANFILGYRYRGFSTTATLNWVSESLYGGFVNTNYFTGTAGTATAPDTRLTLNKDEKTTIDWKLEYSINRHLSAYFLVRNLFNSPRKEFLRGYLPQNQNVVLPLRYFEFGEPDYTVGVRGTF